MVVVMMMLLLLWKCHNWMEYLHTKMWEAIDRLEGKGGLIHPSLLRGPPHCLSLGILHSFPVPWSILALTLSLQQGKWFQQELHTSELQCDFGSELLVQQQELKPLWLLPVLAQCFVCKRGSPWGLILNYFPRCHYILFPSISWAWTGYFLSSGPVSNTPAWAANT